MRNEITIDELQEYLEAMVAERKRASKNFFALASYKVVDSTYDELEIFYNTDGKILAYNSYLGDGMWEYASITEFIEEAKAEGFKKAVSL